MSEPRLTLHDLANWTNDIVELNGWTSAILEIHDDGTFRIVSPVNGALQVIPIHSLEHLEWLTRGEEDPGSDPGNAMDVYLGR